MASFLLRERHSLKNEDTFKEKDNWLRESLRVVDLPLVFQAALRSGAAAHFTMKALYQPQRPEQENHMSVNESSATALVRFTGLAIVCLNKERQRGEVAVIRDNKHELSVRIQRPVFQEGDGNDVVVYQDIVTYQSLPKEDVQIEIKALGKPAIDGFEIYQSGDFDRLESPDPKDFRWIVNMNALHGHKPLNAGAGERYPLTKIYIVNGLFYTHKLDTNLLFEKVGKDASGNATQPELFGNVAETIGVKIEGEVVSFTIRIGAREETQSLTRIDGLPFRIEIRNMDYNADAVYSDMPDYYKYLSSPDGHRFELSPVVEETDAGSAVGRPVNTMDFCHPIVVDDPPSIDQF
jgi:hypothetical protein